MEDFERVKPWSQHNSTSAGWTFRKNQGDSPHQRRSLRDGGRLRVITLHDLQEHPVCDQQKIKTKACKDSTDRLPGTPGPRGRKLSSQRHLWESTGMAARCRGGRPSTQPSGFGLVQELGISIAGIDGLHAAPPQGRLAENHGGVRRHTRVLQDTAFLHSPGSGRLLHPPKGSSGTWCAEGRERRGARLATSSWNPWS